MKSTEIKVLLRHIPISLGQEVFHGEFQVLTTSCQLLSVIAFQDRQGINLLCVFRMTLNIQNHPTLTTLLVCLFHIH